ncbi:MAG: serine/threonine protein kinase [Cyanobacteria bacterium P01_G01_bin.54]
MSELLASLYAPLLAYPHGDCVIQQQRARILQQLGVSRLYVTGASRWGAVPLLGMGYRGVILLGHHPTFGPVALKLRRLDAPIATLQREAQQLQQANRIGIGPILHAAHAEVLMLGYCPGQTLENWLQLPLATATVRGVLAQLLTQAYQLDRLGLDHGELGCPTAHVWIGTGAPLAPSEIPTVTLLDFGSSSSQRRPANVTSLAQGLWIGTRLAPRLAEWLPPTEREGLITMLRDYKRSPGAETFEMLLTGLGLAAIP